MKFYDIKNIQNSVRKNIQKHSLFIKDKSLEIKKKTKEFVPFFVRFGISFIGAILILLPIAAGAVGIAYFEIKYHDKFFPGVSVGGEKVGGLTYDEAFEYFNNKFEEVKDNGISIEFENTQNIKKKVTISASVSGLTADNSTEYFNLLGWESDLRKAYKFGRSLNIFRSIWEQASLVFSRENFDFSVDVQKDAISSLVDGELFNFLKKSKSAEFYFSKNKLYISKEQIGEVINKEEVVNILIKKITQFDTKLIILKASEETEIIKKENLEPFYNFVEDFGRKNSLVFKFNGYKWSVKGTKFVTWFTLKDNKLSINSADLEEYFKENINKFIVNPPKNSRFKIQNSKLVEIVSGKSGNVVNMEKVVQELEKIILDAQNATNLDKKVSNINIETIIVEPKINKDTISKYQIKDLVGEIKTNFTGSSIDREHNIKIGVETINGMLIAPGEEFSTVNSIGRVTGEEGYRKETVIKENKTMKEFGGGLCQVATTLFRLAVNSGLPITERQNHRFVVNYYNPPGLDAAIYGPHPDLRFVNDTGNYLLLQARVENQQVIMELYGRKDGRTVEISKPTMYNRIPAPQTKYIRTPTLSTGQVKCTEMPHDGLTTEVLYTVNYPDGTKKERNFRSVYQPWQKVCLIGS